MVDSMLTMQRTRVLNGLGYKVIRFWNNDVLGNLEGVFEQLRLLLANPSPDLSPKGER
jgi:very-short-patch-repair endonuclease